MVCMTCVNAAAEKKPREEHCNGGVVSNNCDCQHRVSTRADLARATDPFVLDQDLKETP